MHAAVEGVGAGRKLLRAVHAGGLAEADQLRLEQWPPAGALVVRGDVVLDDVEVQEAQLAAREVDDRGSDVAS